MERWIWFLGMAVFYGVLFLWFLNQVKKPDYKKNYVLVKTLQRLCLCFWQQQLSVGIFWIFG